MPPPGGPVPGLTTAEKARLLVSIDRTQHPLASTISPPPDAFNLGLNDGPAAGQTISQFHCGRTHPRDIHACRQRHPQLLKALLDGPSLMELADETSAWHRVERECEARDRLQAAGRHIEKCRAAPGGDPARIQTCSTLYGGITTTHLCWSFLRPARAHGSGRRPSASEPVRGTPLARHSIDAFRRFSLSPVVCLVGYRHEEVSGVLGRDNVYVCSDNPAGGTAYAACEAFIVPGLLEANPLLIITMGDRIVTPTIFRRLSESHCAGDREADSTLLTAVYEPPKNRGKGRVLRDGSRRVVRIVEQRDIDALADSGCAPRLGGPDGGQSSALRDSCRHVAPPLAGADERQRAAPVLLDGHRRNHQPGGRGHTHRDHHGGGPGV